MSQVQERDKMIEKLRREHLKLDEKVSVLESQRWLTAQEEAEMKRLKKLKLAKKDQLEAL
jgi:hypothetical protein